MESTQERVARSPQRPALVTATGIITALSGLVNITWGIVFLTSLVGLLCAPVTILPIVLGAFELGQAARLLTPTAKPATPARALAVFELLCIVFGNVFSAIVGVLALIFYTDAEVRRYFSQVLTTPST